MQILEEKQLWSNFINSLRSPITKQVYSENLKAFMKFHRLESYSSLLVTPEEKIKEYVIHLKENNVSSSRFQIVFAALKNFYEMNDVENIRWNKLKRFCGEPKAKHEDRAYSHEELLLMVSNANIKLKAAILLMASSGMRIGALPSLRLAHLSSTRGLTNGITVYANTPDKYITFMTPECRAAIDTYLQFRERSGEKLNADSPLFRKDFDYLIHEKARNDIHPWTKPAINGALQRHIVAIGLRTEEHINPRSARHDVKFTHGFRKFFETQLINSDVKEGVVKKLMGHADDLTSRYYKPSEEFLYQEYSKAIDALTIDPSKRLQRKVEMLTVEKSKIDQALAAIEEVKRKVGL